MTLSADRLETIAGNINDFYAIPGTYVTSTKPGSGILDYAGDAAALVQLGMGGN
jgi:hypothetical protein